MNSPGAIGTVAGSVTSGGGSKPGNVGWTDETGMLAQNINPAGRSYLSPVVSSGAVHGTADAFWIYGRNFDTSAREVGVLIYDGSANKLLQVDGFAGSGSNSWFSIDISGPALSISASTDYRIGVIGEYAWSNFYRQKGGTGATYNDSAWNTPPNPFTGTSWGTGSFAMYFTVI